MQPAIERLFNKIQWLVDNDKLNDKSLEDYENIINALVNYEQKNNEIISDLHERNFYLESKLTALKSDVKKLIELCLAYDINPDLVFMINEKTIKYILDKKIKVKTSEQLLDTNFYLETIKNVQDHLNLLEQEPDNKLIKQNVKTELEIYKLNYELELIKLNS